VKLAFLALIIAAQCALNSLKAQLRFAYCALGLQIAFCFYGATFLKFRAHPSIKNR
jgi:EamA domain-containing membrane protein RarD